MHRRVRRLRRAAARSAPTHRSPRTTSPNAALHSPLPRLRRRLRRHRRMVSRQTEYEPETARAQVEACLIAARPAPRSASATPSITSTAGSALRSCRRCEAACQPCSPRRRRRRVCHEDQIVPTSAPSLSDASRASCYSRRDGAVGTRVQLRWQSGHDLRVPDIRHGSRQSAAALRGATRCRAVGAPAAWRREVGARDAGLRALMQFNTVAASNTPGGRAVRAGRLRNRGRVPGPQARARRPRAAGCRNRQRNADNVLERCCSDATGDGRSAHANRTLLRACKAAVEHDQYLQLKLIEAASRELPLGSMTRRDSSAPARHPEVDEGALETERGSKSRSARTPGPGSAHAPPRPSRQAPYPLNERNTVEIPKDKILDVIREHGQVRPSRPSRTGAARPGRSRAAFRLA